MLKFRILGPVEALDGEARVALGGRRQLALLALLLLNANRAVSADRLIDALWGDADPARPVKRLQVAIARLRRALEPLALASGDPVLRTLTGGYLLAVGPGELDADVFQARAQDGHRALEQGAPARAAELLRDALALWRGPALANVAYQSFAQAEIRRLEELRLAALEARVDAELAVGHHAELIGELELWIADDPTRERLAGQLMLAQYRCGRQADALDTYQRIRSRLTTELGLEPSAGLRKLQADILQQAPALDAPVPDAGRRPTVSLPPAVAPPVDTPFVTEEGPELVGAEATAGELASTTSAPESATGEPTAADASPADSGSASIQARKTVTVLVGALALRALGARLDPERARRVRAVAVEQAARIITRHGGVFQSGLGVDVSGAFGIPLAHEDDAVRALRAAEELCAAFGALGEREGVRGAKLVARVGIDTGEMLADVGPDHASWFGEPFESAVELARAAADGEILFGQLTRSLAGEQVKAEPGAGSSWRLIALMPGTPPSAHPLSMIGRERELATVHAAFAQTVRERRAQLLTVVGEAGLGKSRLVHEAQNQISSAAILTGRCLSYGEGITYWPLREVLAQAAGEASHAAARMLLEGADDADIVAEIITAALGLGLEASAGEQAPWAFRRLFEVLAERQPLVLVIEDAHWAEPPLLDLLDYLTDWLTAAPLLLLCVTRPELLERHASWGGGRPNVSSVVLSRLSDQEALSVLDQRPQTSSLTHATREKILEAAEGNPLFIEQFLAMQVEDPQRDDPSQIPSTIQALLAARLDRLGMGERTVIERAAIVGREFWRAAVVELSPAATRSSVGHDLRGLVHRGLIRPDRTTLPGQEALRFHHILIQETAYRRTPKTLRAELHERLADWFEQQDSDDEEIIGHHLEQAYHYRGDLGELNGQRETLGRRAAARLAAAGKRAFARGDMSAAANLMRRAAQLLPREDTRRGELLPTLANALIELGELEPAAAILDDAVRLGGASRDHRLEWRARLEQCWLGMLTGTSIRASRAIAERAVRLLGLHDDESSLARAWHLVALTSFQDGTAAAAEEAWERALAYATRCENVREQSETRCWLLIAAVQGPRPVADGLQRCAVELGSPAVNPKVRAYALIEHGVLEAMRGRVTEARAETARGRSLLHELGLDMTAAVTAQESFLIEMLAEDPAAAERELRGAWQTLERMSERFFLSSIVARLAHVVSAQDRHDEAEQLSARSQALAADDDLDAQIWWRLGRANALAAAGRHGEAEPLAREALARAVATDWLTHHADALVTLATVLSAGDRPDEAAALLSTAIQQYERKGNGVAAAKTRALCAPL
jgi:DNA-binding SARP family transcriptional activator